MFHEGHRSLLERAKALGDYLIVGITTEQYDIQRGKLNVADSFMQRFENVRNSGYADEIIIEEHNAQKIDDIKKYKIDILTVGSDWRGHMDYLNEYCQVVYLDRTRNISSSALRDTHRGIVEVGFVGTGRVACRILHEFKLVSGVSVKAVYNPKIKSAEQFANNYELAAAYDDYDMFLSAIDAVYIASPHETHYDYIHKALLAGKHVLCEKPMVLKTKQAVELFKLAHTHKLVLMEAIKTAYAPGFLNLLSVAKSGRIGKIYDIEATFTKLIDNTKNAREYNTPSGGSFSELASYVLLPIIKLLGIEYKHVNFHFFKDNTPVDIYAKAHFIYDNAIASAKMGIGVKSEGQLVISGTRGYILAKAPWWLLKSFEVCYEDPSQNESFSAPFPGDGMRYEIADFIKNINEPGMRTYQVTREESIALAEIIELFLQQRNKDV